MIMRYTHKKEGKKKEKYPVFESALIRHVAGSLWSHHVQEAEGQQAHFP